MEKHQAQAEQTTGLSAIVTGTTIPAETAATTAVKPAPIAKSP
jgi:hypothetical protein